MMLMTTTTTTTRIIIMMGGLAVQEEFSRVTGMVLERIEDHDRVALGREGGNPGQNGGNARQNGGNSNPEAGEGEEEGEQRRGRVGDGDGKGGILEELHGLIMRAKGIRWGGRCF
jgi:hypothetical protein